MSSNRVGPSSSASYRASVSSSSASASRSAWLRRPRIGCATAPTCVAISRRRRAWNASPSGNARCLVAVPACLDDARLEGRPVQREQKTCFAGRCVHDQLLPGRRGIRAGEAAAEPPGEGFARRIDIHHRDLRGGNACQQRCGQQTDDTGTDHQHPLAGKRRRIPCQVQRGLHVGGQHRAVRRHAHRALECTWSPGQGKRPGADAARRRAAHRRTRPTAQ